MFESFDKMQYLSALPTLEYKLPLFAEHRYFADLKYFKYNLNDFWVQITADSTKLSNTFLLRRKVFIIEQKFSHDIDKYDKEALHLSLYFNPLSSKKLLEEPIACCRVYIDYQLNLKFIKYVKHDSKYTNKKDKNFLINNKEDIANETLYLQSIYPVKAPISGNIGLDNINLNQNIRCLTLGRLAVDKSYRGNKIASLLLNEAERAVRTLNFDCILLNSQVDSTNFYHKFSYQSFGDIFEKENIKHQSMYKIL